MRTEVWIGIIGILLVVGIIFSGVWQGLGEIVIGHPNVYSWTDNHITFNIDTRQLAEGSKPPSWTKCVDLQTNRISGINSYYCDQISADWVNGQCWFSPNTIAKINSVTSENGVPMFISLGDACFEDKSETWTWSNAPQTIHLYFDIQPPVSQCDVANDCESWCQSSQCTKPSCTGSWNCISGVCAWTCSQQPPPEPPGGIEIGWPLLAIALIIVLLIIFWRIR